MSKSVKKIIGVVAAIAIPFAAPAIAGSIGISSAVTSALGVSAATGATIGSALTGAALGAGSAALTGGDWRRGALMGGIGGGISGYLDPATAAGLREVSVTGSRYALAPGTAAGFTTAPVAATAAAPAAGAAAPAAAGGTTPAAGAGGAAAPTTVTERIRAAFTPEKVADFTLRAAGQLAGSALAGEGLSADEQALLNAQTEELAWLQQNNRALFEQRLREAQDLLGEARYFDPEYFGLQAARRQQLAGAAAEREQLRGLTGTRRAAEQRRIRLGTARNVGTAYDVGFGTGVSGRLQTRQAGLAQMPTTAPATYGGYEGLLQSYQQARTGREAGLEGMGDLFGSFTGRRQAGLMGPEEEEDKEPVLGG